MKKLRENFDRENLSKGILKQDRVKIAIAMVLAGVLSNQSVNAKDLDTNKEIFKKDVEKISSNKYPAFINVYGVWKRYSDNSYNWVWIKVHNDNFEATAEKWPKFTQGSVIWLTNIWNSNFYMKWWVGYSHFEDYKVWKYTIDPTQTTWWGALWYNLDNKFNIEAWYLAHKLTWAENADTTAYTKYMELIYRTDTNVWQFDLIWLGEQQSAYWKDKDFYHWSLAYYPTKDIKFQATWVNKWYYTKDNYKVRAWIKYTFGWWKKWKILPFISWTYNTSEYTQAEIAYEQNVANRPLQWKDEFENSINIKQIVAQKVAPKAFEEKVKESFNKAPIISKINWPLSVYVWKTITYTVEANDPDKDKLSYSWELNWKTISHNKSATIKFDKIWSYNLTVLVSDGIKTTKKSVTVEVNEIPNQAPTISISANKTTITEWESVTLSANDKDSDWIVKSITWYDENWNKIWTWKTITITENTVWTYTYYAKATDDDGATTQSGSVSIEVKALYNASWSKALQSENNIEWVPEWDISDASWEQTIINNLPDYTSNLPEWSTFKITSISWSSYNEHFYIDWNSLIWNSPDGNSQRTATVTIQIIYPDWTSWPSEDLTVTIDNS